MPLSKSLIKQNCFSIECHNNKDYVGICATVEGSIRYWPSIFNEYLCVDTKFDLQSGDEVSHLAYLTVYIFLTLISFIKLNFCLKQENYYLIITANGNLWSVIIDNADGKV